MTIRLTSFFVVSLLSTSVLAASGRPPLPANQLARSVAEMPPLVDPSPRQVIGKRVRTIAATQPTPSEVRTIKSVVLNANRAQAQPYPDAPLPVTRTLLVNLEPGNPPSVINTAQGLLTTLVFTDMGGNAWPIERVALNASMFNDVSGEDATGTTNVLTLEPLQLAAYSNVAVTLKGQRTPLIFMLGTGQSSNVDMRVDVQVPGVNPTQPVAPIGLNTRQMRPSDNPYLLQFLDGVPPSGAQVLRTPNSQISAWRLNNQTYVRTPFGVLYPAFTGSANSANGMHVYVFRGVMRSVTLVRAGQPQLVQLQEP